MSPTHCSYPSCSKSNQGEKLHKFPEDDSARQLWVSFIHERWPTWVTLKKLNYLCSFHFEDDCYKTSLVWPEGAVTPVETMSKALKKGSQPTVHRIKQHIDLGLKDPTIQAENITEASLNECRLFQSRSDAMSAHTFRLLPLSIFGTTNRKAEVTQTPMVQNSLAGLMTAVSESLNQRQSGRPLVTETIEHVNIKEEVHENHSSADLTHVFKDCGSVNQLDLEALESGNYLKFDSARLFHNVSGEKLAGNTDMNLSCDTHGEMVEVEPDYASVLMGDGAFTTSSDVVSINPQNILMNLLRTNQHMSASDHSGVTKKEAISTVNDQAHHGNIITALGREENMGSLDVNNCHSDKIYRNTVLATGVSADRFDLRRLPQHSTLNNQKCNKKRVKLDSTMFSKFAPLPNYTAARQFTNIRPDTKKNHPISPVSTGNPPQTSFVPPHTIKSQPDIPWNALTVPFSTPRSSSFDLLTFEPSSQQMKVDVNALVKVEAPDNAGWEGLEEMFAGVEEVVRKPIPKKSSSKSLIQQGKAQMQLDLHTRIRVEAPDMLVSIGNHGMSSDFRKKSVTIMPKKKRGRPKLQNKNTMTDEERLAKEERLSLQRKRQCYDWSATQKAYAAYVDSESEEETVDMSDSGSEFSVHSEKESESSSYDELMFGDDLLHLDRDKVKPPLVKEMSVLTLELVAEILEKTFEEKEVEAWKKEISENQDATIFQNLITLGPDSRRYKCHRCEKQVHGSSADMEKHMRDVHLSDLAFGCLLCPLARRTEADLIVHERRHLYHNQQLVCYVCDFHHCTRFDVDWKSIHSLSHPPIDDVAVLNPEAQEKVYEKCYMPNCTSFRSAPFTSRYGLVLHLFKAHTSGNKACDICGKGEMSIWQAKIHHGRCVLKQTGSKKCKLCGTASKKLHEHDCKGRYNCDVCDTKFTNRGGLSRHKKNVHGKEKNKKYTCDVCARAFVESNVLKDHMNTHTGAKPYQCLACGTWHTSQAGLAMHLRSKHNLTTKEMREKYQNCAVPDSPPLEEATVKRRSSNSVKVELNKFTGRKRGRPSTKKGKEVELESENSESPKEEFFEEHSKVENDECSQKEISFSLDEEVDPKQHSLKSEKEVEYNTFTGRKRGRPSTKKQKEAGSSKQEVEFPSCEEVTQKLEVDPSDCNRTTRERSSVEKRKGTERQNESSECLKEENVENPRESMSTAVENLSELESQILTKMEKIEKVNNL